MRTCEICGIEFEPAQTKGRWGNIKDHTHQKYCSPQHQRKAGYLRNMLDPKWRLAKLLSMAKNRAVTKELEFDLTLDHLERLWEEQDGKCALSGREFVLEAGAGRVHPDTVSIDRIVPELGYVSGNVRLVTYHVNVALSEFGENQLYALASSLLGAS